jgi:mycothiol S-conjugate amidase
VIITYADNQEGYPHPDHLRVHDISLVAFDAAGDPDAYPGLGPPWQPSKLYYTAWSRARMMKIHETFLELGIESPFDQKWFDRPNMDDRITTRVDIAELDDVRRAALLAHATQIDPESPFWGFSLPADKIAYGTDDYILARSLVDSGAPEDDLFAGLRERVPSSAGPDGVGHESEET